MVALAIEFEMVDFLFECFFGARAGDFCFEAVGGASPGTAS